MVSPARAGPDERQLESPLAQLIRELRVAYGDCPPTFLQERSEPVPFRGGPVSGLATNNNLILRFTDPTTGISLPDPDPILWSNNVGSLIGATWYPTIFETCNVEVGPAFGVDGDRPTSRRRLEPMVSFALGPSAGPAKGGLVTCDSTRHP